MYESAVIFLGELVRISEEGSDGKKINSYYDWGSIKTIGTCSSEE